MHQKEEQSDRERWQHLADLADFALAMKVTLMNINYQSFNNFMLRIGAYSLLQDLAAAQIGSYVCLSCCSDSSSAKFTSSQVEQVEFSGAAAPSQPSNLYSASGRHDLEHVDSAQES